MNVDEISAGVRTVLHVAKHFEQLKQLTAELFDRFSNQQRNYFTPSEDEETVAMLVSYWHARSALLDLISSSRLDNRLPEQHRPAAFLTAFAASVVLVDAARFLRDTVHHRPVVRRKLNQPAPELGIPAGCYEKIQASLLSARQAWSLYYAYKYFKQHKKELRAVAAQKPLAEVMEIIDRLHHRLRVSVRQFAKAKIRARARQVFRGWLGDALARALYALQRLSGTMLSGRYTRYGHQPGLPDEIITAMRRLLQPGDVLMVRKDYALTNYFLPGYWPHAALYLGDAESLKRMGLDRYPQMQARWSKLLTNGEDELGHVLESLKDGVRIRPLSSTLASDSVVVLRPRLSPDLLAEALGRVMVHEGKRYDFDFDFTRSDRLACTEVIYRAYEGLGSMRFPLTRRVGRLTFSGSDLVEMGLQCDSFETVAVYAPTFSPDLATGEKASDLLRSGLNKPIPSVAV